MALTALQTEVLRVFFELPESAGFVLAGGAGLVVAGMSQRSTEDLDLFTSEVSVEAAGDALESAIEKRGWRSERISTTPTFRRLTIADRTDKVLVDLARDSAPLTTPMITAFGPTYPPSELAARKLLALFGRAALRDFIDVAAVCATFDRSSLVAIAHQVDYGFDERVLADMIGMLERYTDEDIIEYGVDPGALRAFFANW